MTIYGGSHTSFDAGAFTGGAVGGATAIAAAMVSGCAAARAQNWRRWSRDAVLAGIEYSEFQRAAIYDRLQSANRTIAAQARQIEDLTMELRVAQARRLGR